MKPHDMSHEVFRQTILLDIERTKAWIAYWQAEVISGHYKDRKVFRGRGGRQLTEDELRQDSLNTLQSHCHTLERLVDEFKRSANEEIRQLEGVET